MPVYYAHLNTILLRLGEELAQRGLRTSEFGPSYRVDFDVIAYLELFRKAVWLSLS